jgi:hypothetical protein
MNPTETSFLLWGCGVLLAILSFIGALAVNQLMKMANDIGDIKITIGRVDEKHTALEDRVNRIEEKLYT